MITEKVKERLELLTRGVWNTTDIMKYFGFSRTKAWRLKNTAYENGGACTFNDRYVTVPSVLGLMNTSVEKEAETLRTVVGTEEL